MTRGRRNALRLYEHGLVVHQAGSDRPVMWDDVESYADGLFLTVETKDGRAIQFGMHGLQRGEEVVSRLRAEIVVRRTLPRLRALVARGQSVQLRGLDAAEAQAPSNGRTYVSTLTLDSAGITPGESAAAIPWGEVLEWGVSEGQAGG